MSMLVPIDPWRTDLIQVLDEASLLMAQAYQRLGDRVPPEHALAQAGLEHGREIVLDYLEHNEAGLAFEHLRYMIEEPPLVLSESAQCALLRIARYLGQAPA
ncbi:MULTISPECIES: MafI family immunity protein [Pseudomonas]|uniref:MafI family immunity protein n=1 Tax=Pseudomonas sessilinigenes TaxID=658629 RepID=A0ABX8ML03_9PSED|nr:MULTISPECIES: MafI family immunity protein [Pseudomonas]QIH07790.1 MafI family immunity protein [Pseudomonas sp. BIOMIG1BAC]QXH39120.1 MafI family immunity protein [Pseudomonas sessilinigenes]